MNKGNKEGNINNNIIIQASHINSSNFNRLRVQHKKHIIKRNNIKNHIIIEKRIIIQKDMLIILPYSVKRIKVK